MHTIRPLAVCTRAHSRKFATRKLHRKYIRLRTWTDWFDAYCDDCGRRPSLINIFVFLECFRSMRAVWWVIIISLSTHLYVKLYLCRGKKSRLSKSRSNCCWWCCSCPPSLLNNCQSKEQSIMGWLMIRQYRVPYSVIPSLAKVEWNFGSAILSHFIPNRWAMK